MKLKFLFPLFGFIIGTLFASFGWVNLYAAGSILGLSLALWIGVTFLAKNPLNAFRFSNLHLIWITLLFIGLAAFDFDIRCKPSISQPIHDEKCRITGKIYEAYTSSQGDVFKVKVSSIKDSLGNVGCSNITMLVRTDGFVGNKGDIIRFSASPREISSSIKNKSYLSKLQHEGISYTASVGWDKINKIGSSSALSDYFERIREKITILIENSSLDKETSAFLISILLGDKTFLSSETRDTLNSAGMAHILSLSGMHVAIMLTIFFSLLYPLSFLGWYRSRKIIALILLWGFVLLTGAAPSTVRAAIMASFIIVAFILERKNSALNALLVATLFILMYNPFYLWDVGLQLSFLCVASIIIFTNKLNPIDHHTHPKGYKIVNLTLVTIITSFTTWTLVAYYFHTIPLLFLPANFLLLPLLPIFVFLGALYVILLSLGIDFVWLAKALDLYQVLLVGTSDFLSLSGKAVINYSIKPLTVILWLIGILGLALTLYSKTPQFRKMATYSSTGLLLLAVSSIFLKDSPSQRTLLFSHSFTKMEAHLLADDNSTHLEFPRNKISSTKFKDIHILAVDTPATKELLPSLNSYNRAKYRFLIIGPGADLSQIAHLVSNFSFSKIFIHSGIGDKKKMEFLHLIDSSLWDIIHPLREKGSLEITLDPL